MRATADGSPGGRGGRGSPGRVHFAQPSGGRLPQITTSRRPPSTETSRRRPCTCRSDSARRAPGCSAPSGALAAAAGWWLTGAAVALPIALVGGVVLAAAFDDDVRTGGIPNGLVLTGITIVACSWGFVATLDNRMMGPLAVDVLAGVALGGARWSSSSGSSPRD